MTEQKAPMVSVIIATRDRATVLGQCLERVVAQEGGPSEIIVVDNSVDHQSTRMVVARFPGVTYMRADPNKCNPALMRNAGIQASHGDILAFIDDDTLVASGWLESLARAFSLADVGGVVGRIIEEHTPEIYTTDIGKFSPRGEIIGNFNNSINRPVDVQFLHGCNMGVSRAALVRAGLFDPWFGISYEETDLSFRVRSQGYRLLYIPNMVAEHIIAPRPHGVTQRSGSLDLRSRYRTVRSLAFLSVANFGVRDDYAKVAFVNLPRGELFALEKHPSVVGLFRFPAVIAAGIVGYFMAAARALGVHRPPALASDVTAEGTEHE